MTDLVQLRGDVENFSARPDLNGKMDSFIRIAEEMINRDVRIGAQIFATTVSKYSEGAIGVIFTFYGDVPVESSGQARGSLYYMSVPVKILEVVDVFYNNNPLTYIPFAKALEEVNQSGFQPDTWCYYSKQGNQWVFPRNEGVQIYYRAESNILDTTFPGGNAKLWENGGYDAYLYATLRALFASIDADAQVMKYDAAYKEAVASLNKRDKLSKTTASLRRR